MKITTLPLGSAATSNSGDVLPYAVPSTNSTKKMTLWDLVNIPTIVAKYAPIANPSFTGTVIATTFSGALSGNSTTATALAANPTDCSSNQYANAIDAHGNLTCAQVTTSQLSGNISVANGGTGIVSGTSGGILGFTASGTIASSGVLAGNQLVIGGGAGFTPSYLSAGSQYQVLTMGASNPGYGAVNLAQSAAVTGILPIANGGTGLSSYTNTTIQKFTTVGAATYTTPANVKYIEVKMVGGGGGGAGSGTAAGAQATVGGSSLWAHHLGATILTAAGGGKCTFGSAPDDPGTGSIGAGAIGTSFFGGAGGASDFISVNSTVVYEARGSQGGAGAIFGGNGKGAQQNTAGNSAPANSGGGGGGAGCGAANNQFSGGGGAGGGGVIARIYSPESSYDFTVGSAGSGGAAGTSGFAGGNGGSGYIEVWEYYQ